MYYASNSFYELNWTIILVISSLLSLIIGTVVGLTQYRIKRLFAYSTISHVGFILLALSVSSIESTQAFIFYITQYSLSNLNLFIILIAIGFSLFTYISKSPEEDEIADRNNSPIQLISQLKGYYYINPVLSISLVITIFSFAGIPPLLGFFGKQMVLSAALDKGFIFLSIVAITTSVIGAVYYLNIIREIFFYKPNYILDPIYNGNNIYGNIYNKKKDLVQDVVIKPENITISSPIAFTISVITLIILLFMFMNKEWLSMGTILVQILFNS